MYRTYRPGYPSHKSISDFRKSTQWNLRAGSLKALIFLALNVVCAQWFYEPHNGTQASGTYLMRSDGQTKLGKQAIKTRSPLQNCIQAGLSQALFVHVLKKINSILCPTVIII